MSAICRRSWPNMSAISTTGARIDRWDNGRLVHRYHARLIETLKLERSSRYLCSEVFITFISNQYDDGADLILAPYNHLSSRGRNGLIRCARALMYNSSTDSTSICKFIPRPYGCSRSPVIQSRLAPSS